MAPDVNSRKAGIPKYHQLELEEVFQKTRATENIRIQLGTFIGTINLTVLGIAFSSTKVGIFFIAIGTLLIFMMMDTFVIRKSLRILYERGMELEEKYSPDPERSIMHIRRGASKDKIYPRNPSFSGFWLPIYVSVSELSLAIYLLYTGWSLF